MSVQPPERRLERLCARSSLRLGPDGVYARSDLGPTPDQDLERRIRERDAGRVFGNCDEYLDYVATLYSIPVMVREVTDFLHQMPPAATVLDIGGGFGWVWRDLAHQRPDVAVVIVDFVRDHFRHARNLLGSLVGRQVAFVHGNATDLPFVTDDGPDRPAAGPFDGIWTVQAFQHIPDFETASREACRVLRPGGTFINYSMQATPAIRLLYRLLGRHYHVDGFTRPGPGQMFFARAADGQARIIGDVFGGPVACRYSEHFFHTELRSTRFGRPGSIVGRLDAVMGCYPSVGRWIARQRSFQVTKAHSAVS